jgi:hypothetical protein
VRVNDARRKLQVSALLALEVLKFAFLPSLIPILVAPQSIAATSWPRKV